MSGYGQEILQQTQAGQISPQLAQAIAQQEQLRNNATGFERMVAGNNGAAGYGGVLAMALGSYLNKKNGDKIAQGEADITQQIQQFQAQQAQAIEAKKKQAQDNEYKQKYESALAIVKDPAKARAVAIGQAKLSDWQEKPTELSRNLSNPETKAYLEMKAKNSGVKVTNNIPSSEGQSAFDKEFAKGNVEFYKQLRNDAIMANQTQSTLDQIKPMLEAFDTGFPQQGLAIAGKLFGTERAQNYESVQGLVGSLVMQELNKMKGSAQISERQYIEGLQASYDKTPEANKRIIQYLSDKNKDVLNNFSEADSYLKEHRNLRDYTPSFNTKQKKEPEQDKKQSQQYPDGTVIENAQGQRMVMKSGQWVGQ